MTASGTSRFAVREFKSKPGRRRQREGPGKDCFRISDVFATHSYLGPNFFDFCQVLLLHLLYLRKNDCGNFSKNEAIEVAREARRPRDLVNFTCSRAPVFSAISLLFH